jgi:hypothetical protein
LAVVGSSKRLGRNARWGKLAATRREKMRRADSRKAILPTKARPACVRQIPAAFGRFFVLVVPCTQYPAQRDRPAALGAKGLHRTVQQRLSPSPDTGHLAHALRLAPRRGLTTALDSEI